MNKFKKVMLVIGVLTVLLFILPIFANAQGPIDPGCDPADPTCPIDGGLTLLIAAGIGIGAKKVFKSKN